MDRIVLIGDEVAAAGFALAGVDVRVPGADAVAPCFDEALRGAGLVVLTPSVAAALDPATLHAAVARGAPPVVVMPDLVAPAADAAFARRIRLALGIEA